MFYLRLIITLVIAFIFCLWVDHYICSEKFNNKYTKKCLKLLDRVNPEQKERTLEWLKAHLSASIEKETMGTDIIKQLPVDLRYKVNERKLRAYMSILGYKPLSNCFLDPSTYSVELK